MTLDAAMLLRYLRQRLELGQQEWLLESLSGDEATAALVRGVSSAGQTSRAAQSALAAPMARSGRQGAGRAGAGREAGAGRDEGENAGPAAVAPDPAGTGDRAAALATLAEEASGCTRCRLCEGRHSVVFGEGSVAADVVVVGEAPGAEEDRTGRPFVGPAGKLLDLLLLSAGFPRDRVYICNVLKCRPPKNRDPMADEVASCTPYLRRQIELIEPKVLLAVGRFAAQTLLASDETMGRMRGQVRAYRGVPVVASYHPAYLLRSPRAVRPAWEDFQLLRRVFDEQG